MESSWPRKASVTTGCALANKFDWPWTGGALMGRPVMSAWIKGVQLPSPSLNPGGEVGIGVLGMTDGVCMGACGTTHGVDNVGGVVDELSGFKFGPAGLLPVMAFNCDAAKAFFLAISSLICAMVGGALRSS